MGDSRPVQIEATYIETIHEYIYLGQKLTVLEATQISEIKTEFSWDRQRSESLKAYL